jgi:hypothetical protein
MSELRKKAQGERMKGETWRRDGRRSLAQRIAGTLKGCDDERLAGVLKTRASTIRGNSKIHNIAHEEMDIHRCSPLVSLHHDVSPPSVSWQAVILEHTPLASFWILYPYLVHLIFLSIPSFSSPSVAVSPLSRIAVFISIFPSYSRPPYLSTIHLYTHLSRRFFLSSYFFRRVLCVPCPVCYISCNPVHAFIPSTISLMIRQCDEALRCLIDCILLWHRLSTCVT